MQKLFENWHKYLNEDWDEDVAAVADRLAQRKKVWRANVARAKQREKTAKAGAEAWKLSGDDADWEKFKKWKDEEGRPPEQPEDYEKALSQQKKNRAPDILSYNCKKIKRWISGTSWSRIGTFTCDSLIEATQGLAEKQGRPSQIFSDSKFIKVIGEGAYGVAILFDNGHIVKIFKGGVHGGLEAELKTYAKLLSSQLAGSAKSHDLAVYEYGTIPVYVPDALMDMVPPVEYLGYAEIGKVIPFKSWLEDNFEPDAAGDIYNFFDLDLYSGLEYASRRSITRIRYGNDLAPYHVRPFEKIKGGAEEYADYIIKWIKIRGLDKNARGERHYGWAKDRFSSDDESEVPAMPPQLYSAKGRKLLKDFLVALYDVAKSNDGEFLFGKQTNDVHTDNFGVSYQTDEIIIFDR